MSLLQILRIMWSRRYVSLIVFLLVVVAATAFALVRAKAYVAETTVLVDMRQIDPLATSLSSATVSSYMATQVDIVNSDRVAQKVVRVMKLNQSPVIREQWLETTGGKGELDVWLANLLQRKLAVVPSRESNLIIIRYRSPDPVFSAAVANAFAQAYIDTNIELKVEPARQYARWFSSQGASLRESLEKAQARLSEYQQKNGLLVTDERLDTEVAKLADLSQQLTALQTQATDSQSKQRSGDAALLLPDVMQNGLLVALKSDIARQEAKLSELAQSLGVNHPQYQRLETELKNLKEQLTMEEGRITKGFSASQGVYRNREASLRVLIEAQKQRILELRSRRDEAQVLLAEVNTAQKAYDSVAQRFTQTNLESQTTQTNVSILTPASAPLIAASPNIRLIIPLGCLFGVVIGIAAGFIAEAIQRRVRSAEDVAFGLGDTLPVLAVIPDCRRGSFSGAEGKGVMASLRQRFSRSATMKLAANS